MNLQFDVIELFELSVFQFLSFQTSWFIYKTLTASTISNWKILLLNFLGIGLSFVQINGFCYQLVVFLGLAFMERNRQRMMILGSLFFGAYPVIFTDLFARFTPIYVFDNLFPNVSLTQIRGNFFLVVLVYLLIYPAFRYIDYLSKVDTERLRELFYYRGRESLLLVADLLFLTYIMGTCFLIFTGLDGSLFIFVSMAIYLLMVITLNRHSHKFSQERTQEAIDTYIYNLEVYNQHIEDLYNKVRPIQKDFEKLLIALEVPLANNRVNEVISAYHDHLSQLDLTDLDLDTKLTVLLDIPYPELRSWLVNQIVPLEQKGISVQIRVDVADYPPYLKIAELITVLKKCLERAEFLWRQEPETNISIDIQGKQPNQLTFRIGNTNQEAQTKLDPALYIERDLAQFCWSNGIELTNKKELFKTYQIITITS